MTISIVIPVFNVEEYLPKCLDSILIDNNFDGEVICVNDGSTDNSLSILRDYANKFGNIKIINQDNKGLSEARNSGLRVATGDYILFVDSDDWLFPDSLQQIIAKLDGEEILYFNSKKVYEETGEVDGNIAIPERRHISGQAYFAAIQEEPRNVPSGCVCSGIYKRSFLTDNNLWNEPGIYHEDSYFTPQALLKAQDVSCVNDYVYAYRIRTKGSITASTKPKHIKDSLFICRNLYRIINGYDKLPDAFYSYIADFYIDLICRAYDHNLLLSQWWRTKDSVYFIHCNRNIRQRKVAKLSLISPKLSYAYLTDKLPGIFRRGINRFL